MAAVPCPSRSSTPETDFDGSFKSFIAHRRVRPDGLFPHERDFTSEQRLRLMGRASYGPLLAEYAHEGSFFAQSRNEPFGPLPPLAPPPAWEASWQPIDKINYDFSHRIDRAFLQLSSGSFELAAGKQVIAMGVGRIFQAVSQVPRLPFVILDPEYPRTEDAIAASWKGELGLEARFLPKARGQAEHNFHVRAKTQVGEYDTALTAGRSDGKELIGLEAAGNIGDAVLRAEAVAYHLGNRLYYQGLIGLEKVFSEKWSGGFELFYNGLNGIPHRSTPYLGKFYVGSSVAWEASARWKLSLFALVNGEEPSALLNPAFAFSVATDLDLIGGQFLSLGGPASEFIALPDITYLGVKASF